MNDFERRFLDILQTSSYVAQVARQGQRIVNIDYFAYNLRIGTVASTIANGANGQGAVQIQADSDFVLTFMSGDVLNAAGSTVLASPNVLVQVTDTGSGKTFYNEPTLFGLVTGRSGFPYLLPTPRLINPNTNLKVDVTNNTGAATAGIFVSFQGARIYYG